MAQVSPNEMMQAAKDMMLDGREPTSDLDWQLIVNFLAVNIHEEVALPAINLMKALYSIPLSDEDIETIVQSQLDYKEEAVNA